MKMSDIILTRLLKGEHFNVEERKALGVWPSEVLRFEEIQKHLTNLLEKEKWFPRELSKLEAGSTIFEGIVIHQEAPNRFICYAQRSSALDPRRVAEKVVNTFETASEAAHYYLKWELNLPGNLDGWKVVKN